MLGFFGDSTVWTSLTLCSWLSVKIQLLIIVEAAEVPVNLLDLIHKHFGYSQFWSSQPARNQNWAGSCMPDLTAHIRFISILLKKAWIILCETGLDPNWMAWSGFGQTHLVWKQANVQRSLSPVLAECKCHTATFKLSCLLPQMARLYCTKPAQIQFGSGWLCWVWAKEIWSWSKPVCKNHRAGFWPTLLSRSGLDVNWIRHVSWSNVS